MNIRKTSSTLMMALALVSLATPFTAQSAMAQEGAPRVDHVACSASSEVARIKVGPNEDIKSLESAINQAVTALEQCKTPNPTATVEIQEGAGELELPKYIQNNGAGTLKILGYAKKEGDKVTERAKIKVPATGSEFRRAVMLENVEITTAGTAIRAQDHLTVMNSKFTGTTANALAVKTEKVNGYPQINLKNNEFTDIKIWDNASVRSEGEIHDNNVIVNTEHLPLITVGKTTDIPEKTLSIKSNNFTVRRDLARAEQRPIIELSQPKVDIFLNSFVSPPSSPNVIGVALYNPSGSVGSENYKPLEDVKIFRNLFSVHTAVANPKKAGIEQGPGKVKAVSINRNDFSLSTYVLPNGLTQLQRDRFDASCNHWGGTEQQSRQKRAFTNATGLGQVVLAPQTIETFCAPTQEPTPVDVPEAQAPNGPQGQPQAPAPGAPNPENPGTAPGGNGQGQNNPAPKPGPGGNGGGNGGGSAPAPRPAPVPPAPVPPVQPGPRPQNPAPAPQPGPGRPNPAPRPESTPSPAPRPAEFRRLSGETRFETAVAASQARFPNKADAVILTRGDVAADSVSAAPLAKELGAPILLTPSNALHPATANEIRRVLRSGGMVYVMGGEQAVSNEVVRAVQALGARVERIAGVNRAATAVATAERLAARGKVSQVLLADGFDWQPDLIAGPAAAKVGGVTLLTNGATMAPETAAYLRANQNLKVTAIGDRAASTRAASATITAANPTDLSVQVARTFIGDGTAVGVATTADFADALVGGGDIAQRDGALVLVPSTVPASVIRYAQGAPAGTSLYIYGGEQRISAAQERALRAALQR